MQASPLAAPRGLDGAKKVDGVKRHGLVDSAAILVAAVVTAAHVGDRSAYPMLGRPAQRIAPSIATSW